MSLFDDPLTQWGVFEKRYACCYQLVGSPGCWIAEPTATRTKPRGYKFGHKWVPGESASKLFASVRTFRSSMFYSDQATAEAAYQKILALMLQHRVADAVAAFFSKLPRVMVEKLTDNVRRALFEIFALYKTLNGRLRVRPVDTPSADASRVQWGEFLALKYFRPPLRPHAATFVPPPAPAVVPSPAPAVVPPPAATIVPPPAPTVVHPPAAYLAQFAAEFSNNGNVLAVKNAIDDALRAPTPQAYLNTIAAITPEAMGTFGALIRKHLQPIALDIANFFQKAGIQDSSDILTPSLNLANTGPLDERKANLRAKASRLFHLTDWLEYWALHGENPNINSLDPAVDQRRIALLTIDFGDDDDDDTPMDAAALAKWSLTFLKQFRALFDYIRNGGVAFLPHARQKILDKIRSARCVWFSIPPMEPAVYDQWALAPRTQMFQLVENTEAFDKGQPFLFYVQPDKNDKRYVDMTDLHKKLSPLTLALKDLMLLAKDFEQPPP